MLFENYAPLAWTNGGIEAVKALWNEHFAHRSWHRFQQKTAGAGALMIYLKNRHASLNAFESYA
jgi:hypothetical protein